MTLDNTGRFSYQAYDTYNPGPGTNWDDSPNYFVFFDGKALMSGRPPGGSYQVAEAGADWLRPLGPPQHLFAPWPLLAESLGSHESMIAGNAMPLWANQVASLDLSVDEKEGSMAFTWRAQGKGTTVVREVRFSDFRPTSGYTLPWNIHERTTISTQAGENSSEVAYTVEDLRVNPPDASERLRFDPVVMSVNRYDEGTGDVFSPTGEFLYNEKDWSDRLARQSGRFAPLRRWGLPGLALVTALSVYWGYRRHSRGQEG